MEKKYKLLTDDIINIDGHTLYRIKALRDFGNIHKGCIGGYIENESNLSHEGNCWVAGNAKVYGNAMVYRNAIVYGNAKVYGNARVFDNAQVYGNAIVYGVSKVFDSAQVFDGASVYCANVRDNAWVHDNAEVLLYATIRTNADIYKDAYITGDFDYCFISGFGSEARATTFYKTKDNIIRVVCGCFDGTLEEFKSKVKLTHGDNKYAKEYLMAIDLATMHFNNKLE